MLNRSSRQTRRVQFSARVLRSNLMSAALVAVTLTSTVMAGRPESTPAGGDRTGSATDQQSTDGIALTQYLDNDKGTGSILKELDIQLLDNGGSSRELMQSATRGLPLQFVSPANQIRVRQLLQTATMYRRLPTVSLDVEPDVYRYFTQHPDAAVSIWRVMEISKFRMWQTGPNVWEADAGDGSVGRVEVLYEAANECLVLCDGLYQPSLPIKPIAAQALIHLETVFKKAPNGNPQVTHRVNLFVTFPSQPVKMAARLVSPLSNAIIDKNFVEVSRFLRLMSYAMEHRPGWVESLGNQMEEVLPSSRERFLKLAAQTYVRTRKRNLEQSMQSRPVTLEEVLPPVGQPTSLRKPAPLRVDGDARPIAIQPANSTTPVLVR